MGLILRERQLGSLGGPEQALAGQVVSNHGCMARECWMHPLSVTGFHTATCPGTGGTSCLYWHLPVQELESEDDRLRQQQKLILLAKNSVAIFCRDYIIIHLGSIKSSVNSSYCSSIPNQ